MMFNNYNGVTFEAKILKGFYKRCDVGLRKPSCGLIDEADEGFVVAGKGCR
jgi:hypothetical protein